MRCTNWNVFSLLRAGSKRLRRKRDTWRRESYQFSVRQLFTSFDDVQGDGKIFMKFNHNL